MMIQSHNPAALELMAQQVNEQMRASEDCEKRVLVVPETQYNALGGLTDETYQTRTGALYKLFETRIKYEKTAREA
jgi:hypothetical protein